MNSIKFKNPCILCGEVNQTIIAEDAYPFINKIKNVVCNGCGLGRIEPFPSAIALKEHYENYRKNTINIEEPTDEYEDTARENALYHYSFFKEDLPKQATILDIGCGAGTLLSCAIKDGHIGYGVNPDKGFGEYGKKNYGVKKVEICMFEDAKFPDDKFDMVTFNHVFEHFVDPHHILQKVKKILKKDGNIYMSIPNALIPHGQLEYNYFDEHIYTFTPKTITQILSVNGFRLKKYSTYGMPLSNGLHQNWIDLVATNIETKKPAYSNIEMIKHAEDVISFINNYKLAYINKYGKIKLYLGIKRIKFGKKFLNSSGITKLFYRFLLRTLKNFSHYEKDYSGRTSTIKFPKNKIEKG